jgi:HEAT repeat protein
MLACLLLVLSSAQAEIAKAVLAPLELRVPHLGERLASPEAAVRRRALVELTTFVPRDSQHYPPLFRHLLGDPSPAMRWEALSRLDDHGIVLPPAELPHSIEVPLVGELVLDDPTSLETMRARCRDGGASSGWAIRALGLAGDSGAVELALELRSSENAFVRHSAAVALLHLDREPEARVLLRALVAASEGDPSRFYSAIAAERLVRLGESAYLGALVELIPARAEYADRVEGLLEDLTGEHFSSESEWKTWWQGRANAPELSRER